MPQDTEIDNLVINQLTQAQYNGASINNNELYFVTDGKISADDVDDSNATNKFVTASDKTNWNAKQDELVSGTNIKTVNSTSLLGSGNIDVQETLISGSNIKTVNSNSLLGSGDVTVQETLVSGTNIKTINNQSLLGSGNITISTGGTATDVQINGTSITSNNVADIITETAYNATTNKIATKADIPTDTSDLTNNAGYITGINSSDVTTALGYTPYSSSNPNGYTSNTGTVTQVNAGVGLNTTSDDSDMDGGSLTSTGTLFLTKTGVTAGTYQGITVDKYGRVTGASNQGYTTNTGTVTSVQVQAGTGLTSSTSTAQTTTLNTTIEIDSGYKLPTTTEWGNKQDTLVSGTNIKTINSESILGSGDISTAVVTNDTLSGSGTSASPLKVSANRLKRACCWKNETTISNGTLINYNGTEEKSISTSNFYMGIGANSNSCYIVDGKIYTGKIGSEVQKGTDYSDWDIVANMNSVYAVRNGALYNINSSTSVLVDDTKNYTDVVAMYNNHYAIADGAVYSIYNSNNGLSLVNNSVTFTKMFFLYKGTSSTIPKGYFLDSNNKLYRNASQSTLSLVGSGASFTMAFVYRETEYGVGIINGALYQIYRGSTYLIDNTETWVDCVGGDICYAITQTGKLYSISSVNTANGATLTQVGTDTDWTKVSKVYSYPIFIKGGYCVSLSGSTVTVISSSNQISKVSGSYSSASSNYAFYWTGAETTTTTLRYTTNYPKVGDNTYVNVSGTAGATITSTTSGTISDGTLTYTRDTADDSTFTTLPTELNTQTLTTKQLIDLLEE